MRPPDGTMPGAVEAACEATGSNDGILESGTQPRGGARLTGKVPHEPPGHVHVPAADAAEPVPFTILFRFSDRQDALLMSLGVVGAIGNGLSMPIFTIIFGDTLNGFGENLDDPEALREAVNNNVLKLVWIGIGAFVGSYLQMACWTATASRQVNRIRHRYLDSLLRQDVGYFDTQATSGLLLQGLTEDCIQIQHGMGEKLGMTIYAVACFLGGMIIAFVRGWQMALVMLAAAPFLIATGYLASVFLRKYTAVADRAYADANTIAQQALSNVRTVYSFNAEERTVDAYSSCLQQPLHVGIRQGFVGGLTLGMTNGTLFCMYALALWYGSTRVVDGAYTGGQVLNVLTAVVIGAVTLGTAAPNLQHFMQAKMAGGRVFSLMARPPTINLDAPGETIEGEVQGRLEFRDVAFAYPARPDVPIFSCFNLDVPAGTTVALVGESGSGKSTVVGLIERFYDPLQGQVLLDGVDFRRLQLQFLRSHLSLVSQEPTLFATTIAANISYAKPGATMEEITQAAKSANAHQFISKLPKGYDTHVGEGGIQMSGGQKQRIAIARAVLKDPKVLLLDEATSALDAASERVVQDALDRLLVGRTTVVVAHRLSTIRHADMIAVVKKGEVVERGTHEALMAENGVYAGLVMLQQAVGLVEAEAQSEEQPSMPSIAQQASFTQPSFRSLPSSTNAMELAHTVEDDGRLSSQEAGSIFHRLLCCRRRPKAAPLLGNKSEEDAPKPVPISRIAALNKPELLAAVTGLLGSAVLGLQMPAFAIAFSSFINLFFTNDLGELQSEARKWALIFVGIGAVALVFSVLQSYSFNYMGQKLAYRVRILMMAALLRQEVGWFDQEKNSSGMLASKLSSDPLAVKGQFGDTMGMLTQNMATLIASTVVAFTAAWRMTLVMLSVVPLLAVAAFLQFKFVASASSKEEETFNEANQTAAEALSSIRTVAAFGMEQQMSLRYSEKLERPTEAAHRRAHSSGLGFGFGQFVIFGVYALAFWVGGIQVTNGSSTFKDILLAALAIALAAVGMAQAQMYFPDVAKGKSATERVFAIIDRKPTIDASTGEGEQPAECNGVIELRDITFAYPSRPEVKVFRRLSLSVPAGTTAALVGESGSGKSTVVGLIERFYDPLQGQVLLDGMDIRGLNLHWLRQHVALVSQEPVLFTGTVLENIRYGQPDATLADVMAAARAANAHTFIEALPEGYDTRLGEQAIKLSGGQKQRVAIARAVVKDPRVLLLDEATSALDAESEHVVQEALDRLMVGRTTVVVAHRLTTVRTADCISVVHRGRIIEQGRHEELMALAPRGTYARLVQNQLTGRGIQ